ncbi:MAG: DNA-processing protein DprA [Promethearchaeia archaeon]
MKFSKSGLINLFQDPMMQISYFKSIDTKKLIKYLLSENKFDLDKFNFISELYNFNFNKKEYKDLEKQIKYCIEHNISVITPFTENIPKLFKILKPKTRDLIFIKGKIKDDDLKSYSICGSRTPTKDAIIKTKQIAKIFAKKGFTLINGFAKGIDIEAFLGANKEGGRYIGVLASGVENVYPPENKKYIKQVINNGALISQNLLWNRVSKLALQLRNRFSAQLSLGSIFIEGNYKSGTKWQFKFAKEAQRPIFYLEPKDWNHENAHILKLIREEGGFEISNDLSNIDDVIEILENAYSKRLKNFKNAIN